ncbi:MAG: flagellin, partial [Oscillospiraceae bacterium]
QHNLNAMTAYNKLNTNVSGLKKSSEKLSSGYRINRAGDDAAGLAISEKMRSQIKGLNQAVRNSQDGINMIQTYEGAAQETHNILQRMKELASESANGTYDNTTDRDAIQLEFDQLNDELNQIADTDFNGRLALNGGTMADGSIASNNSIVTGKPTVASNPIEDNASAVTYKGGVNGYIDQGGNGMVNVDGVSLKLKGGIIDDGGKSVTTIGDTSYKVTTKIETDKGEVASGVITATTTLKVNADTKRVTIYGRTYSVKNDQTDYYLVDDKGTKIENVDGAKIDYSGITKSTGEGAIKVTQEYTVNAGGSVQTASGTVVGNIKLSKGVSISDAFEHGRRNLTYSNSITLQTGARSKDAVDFTFSYSTSGIGDLNADLDISARGLGTAQLSLVTAEKANEAIDHIDNAINKTSMVRATFGAMQNRLEHKIDNLTTTSTNLSEAESNIRDTDMANEMMNYTKYNILQQAAQSMLAQANQQPQSILQLLG